MHFLRGLACAGALAPASVWQLPGEAWRLPECTRANTPRESLQYYQLIHRSTNTCAAILIMLHYSVTEAVSLNPAKVFLAQSVS